ncbi:hypothetical protein MS3_00003569 [Schistosoma haematobium]|uniref:Uncharacterized protein n=1 Tax=Schistosoma haematobium TaxID=6185 RepID=A0A922LPU5_SCHHA|nr:hypothetical protein MS3_00003569 [Schistosoma haematobium]KAH9591188.1 hypothetical protein MS3_00003569 [Schistosoma haematobium]CAH8673478.1 unnamed protein product [Schistosoma haematobium]
MMHFGLTQRELLQYTQTTQPNVLKPGVIDEVVNVLLKHYKKCEDERIHSLAEVERKRMQNLEAETELKQIHLCLKREPKCQTKKLTRKTVKPSIDWMETQKPGMHPPPDSNKCKKIKDDDLLAKAETDIYNQTDNDPKNRYTDVNHSNRLKELDPDACLHLPLGLVRNPTPRTKKFLSSETNESLYATANQIVYSSSDDQAQKR